MTVITQLKNVFLLYLCKVAKIKKVQYFKRSLNILQM